MSLSGDRHLRPEPSGRLKGLVSGPRTVLVRAMTPYAQTFAGQALLQLLINLLCRQFGVVDAVRLDIPHVPVDQRAFPPPVRFAPDLPGQLLALGRAVCGDEMRVAPAGQDEDEASGNPPTVVVLVGSNLNPDIDPERAPCRLVAYGDGWDAFCSLVERSPDTDAASLVPFGPQLAACLATGQVFRHFYHVASPCTSDIGLCAFGSGVWRDGGGPELATVTLPATHLVGLGAVGAAFALALASAPGLSGVLIGMDPQDTDETGRNRLLSALYDEVGLPKASLVARLFDGTDVRFYLNVTHWPDYATDPRRKAPPEVRAAEDAFQYAWVVSCVDRNIHRRNIANYLPRHVLSGSTDGLVAQATYYAMKGNCECLACNHPVATFSLEERVDELRGLSPAERLQRYARWDLEPAVQAAIDEYLHHPECGHVAEAELRRLGVDGTTDWSVGFVSAASGVMLAAYFVRCSIESTEVAVGDEPERRLIFLGPQEVTRSRAQRKAGCAVCGDVATLERYEQRWKPKTTSA